MPPRPVKEDRIAFLLSRVTGGIDEDEYGGVYKELRHTMNELVDHVFDRDFQAPPLFELYWRERATIYADKPWVEERARLALALQRDLTPLLHLQVEERRRYGGNIVLEFSGPTGMGKSSSMLYFAERHNRLQEHVRAGGVDALRARLGVDIADIPSKLENLGPGDVVMLDEQFSLVGENSLTHLSVLRSCEESLRGTQIDLHFASPTSKDHSTTQGVLLAMSNSPARKRDGTPGRMATRFLYLLDVGGETIPLGTVTLPWCSPETFAAYSVVKEEQLARTKKFQFHAAGAVNERVIRALFEDERLTLRLQINERPKKKDWQRYVRQYGPSMSLSEVEAHADELEEMVICLQDPEMRGTFPRIWGFPPPEGMLRALDIEGADGGASA